MIVRLALALGLLALGAMAALAHDAPMGWSYSADCCSETDCEQVDEEAIQEVEGGFRVTMPRGSHRMLRGRGITAFVPHGDKRIRKSGDWHKHACVSPDGTIFCIYIPPGGT